MYGQQQARYARNHAINRDLSLFPRDDIFLLWYISFDDIPQMLIDADMPYWKTDKPQTKRSPTPQIPTCNLLTHSFTSDHNLSIASQLADQVTTHQLLKLLTIFFDILIFA